MQKNFYFFIFLVLSFGLQACGSPYFSIVKSGFTDNKVSPAQPEIEVLIDKLQEESNESIGLHSLAWAEGFMALDEEPQFRGGVIGTAKPVTSITMRALVQQGVRAIPLLLRHLSDDRPTKLTLSKGTFPEIRWFGDEYDSRYKDITKQPASVNSKEDYRTRRKVAEYTFRVGDLCFVALGQIVNRNLSGTRYQPSCCLVINSPVATPTLALAAKQDWASLSTEEHKNLLKQDCLSKYPYATSAAIQRLLFYYPQEGEAMVLKLLRRPLYDGSALWRFISEQLVKTESINEWQTLINKFHHQAGKPAADSIPFRVQWIYFETSFVQDEKFRQEKERAAKILALLYPRYNSLEPYFINASELDEQTDLIKSLSPFRSETLDAAIAEVFNNALKLKSESENDVYQMDQLAINCLARFDGKKYNQVFSPYLNRRIRELSSTRNSEAHKNRRQQFLDWQKKMHK